MIRVVWFDLGQTLVDAQRRPFPHVPAALAAIAGFHTAAGKPLRIALISDFTMVEPPLTPARVKPVFDEYLAILDATGLRHFFEPVARRVTLSTHAGVAKPARALFEKALGRLQLKAGLDECALITEEAAHIEAVRTKLGMKALRFGPAGAHGVDFSDWSQAPALLAHLLGTPGGDNVSNVHAAITAHLAALGVEVEGIRGGDAAGEFHVFHASGHTWHATSLPGHPALDPLLVALPAQALVRRGPSGALKAEVAAPDAKALSEAGAFAGSLAAHGQIAGLQGQAKSPTHAIEKDAEGRPRLVRKRFSAF